MQICYPPQIIHLNYKNDPDTMATDTHVPFNRCSYVKEVGVKIYPDFHLLLEINFSHAET
jgi:hypothetical protein